MKRTTVMLPERLRVQAMQRAHNLGISFGELVRRSLEAMIEGEPEEDSLRGDDAVYEGPVPDDLSSDPDRYLYGNEP